jgi:hypothetical protein
VKSRCAARRQWSRFVDANVNFADSRSNIFEKRANENVNRG